MKSAERFTGVYARLGVMMFFQYMMFAVWWIPLAAYLYHLEISRNLIALILSSMAFGSVVSPMVGMLADRYFRSERLLAFSNLVVAILLLFVANTSNPVFLFVFMLLTMLFYMPTWALTSSITMANVSSDNFARVRVFGTIGWISAGIFSIISVGWLGIDFDGTHRPFYFGSVLAVITAIFNLTLPKTSVKEKQVKASYLDIMGFRTITMMKNRNYAMFILLFYLSMIPFSMYWSYFSEYLADRGYKLITITMSTGQILEIFILLSVPWFIKRYGLRNTMIVGLVGLVVRYVALYFAGDDATLAFVLIGAGVHGIIFGYYHLGSQIYTDKKAPPELKSQAQGFIFFVTFAPGLLTGNFICGWIIRAFSTEGADGTVYQWDTIWGITALMSVAVLITFLLLFKKENYDPI